MKKALVETLIAVNSSDQIWKNLDDRVMGGSSQSYVTLFDDYAKFQGKVVSQNGGFCSLRSENFNPPLYLSHVKGLKFQARSKDNYIYQFNMKDEPGWNSVSWIAEFELQSGD